MAPATGGSAGAVASTCGAGFVFCDDFEDGSDDGWTKSGGSWTVITDTADGGTNHVYQGGGASEEALASATSAVTDQTVEARMRAATFVGSGSSYRAGIIARRADASNFYTFSIDQDGLLVLLKSTSSLSNCESMASGVDPMSWNTYKMVVQGSPGSVHITTYLNGVLKHDCTTTASAAPAAGSAGVLTYGSGTVADFDDIRVSSP